MLHSVLTYGNGFVVYLAALAALACLYAAFAAGRRDLAEKARIVSQMAGQAWREIADEWGPVLATSTGRNSLMLKLAGWFGLFLPAAWSEHGAKLAVATMLVFFWLRTLEGRKRAAGPVVTPRDAKAMEASTGISAFGAEMQRRSEMAAPQPPSPWFEELLSSAQGSAAPLVTEPRIEVARSALRKPAPKKRKPESARSKNRRARR